MDTTPRLATELLNQWLNTRLSQEQSNWLINRLERITKANSDTELHITLGLIPRKLGQTEFVLAATELAQAHTWCNGWKPTNWRTDTAARLWVLSAVAENDSASFGELIVDLSRTADLAELIAIYQGLPLYPASDALNRQVAEGLRSNIKAVFEAIAHHNPYPACHFDDHQWNHMVLKALFVGSRLAPIVGLDQRANAELADILCDYAHERWAADRTVSFELWRCVGPFATGKKLEDLERACNTDNPVELQAALLALNDSQSSDADDILKNYPNISTRIRHGDLTWQNVEENLNT